MKRLWSIGILLVLVLAGCSVQTTQRTSEYDFGIAYSLGDGNFTQAFELGEEINANVAQLPLSWNEIEQAPRVYEQEQLIDANTFYAKHNMSVALEVNPIDTINIRVPEDLYGKSYDDPAMITRYNQMIDVVLSQLSDVTITSITIGNEIDEALRTPEEWRAYTNFFVAVKTHVQETHPFIPVSAKITVRNIFSNNAQVFNTYTDVVMLTYYPLDETLLVIPPSSIHSTLLSLQEMYPTQDLYLSEVGCPSSEVVGSSELTQAQFYKQLFKAINQHDEVKHVMIQWLHDQSPESIAYFSQYYDSSDEKFLGFLSSLGVRKYNGTPKAAWEEIVKART